jgi:hypothetical protein
LAKWIKKEDPTTYYLQETHIMDRNKHCHREKELKKLYQANAPPLKQAEVIIHI